MPKKPASLNILSGAQQLQIEFWNNYSDTAIQKAINGEPIMLLEEMVTRLETITTVSDAYIIVHDKDTKKVWIPDKKIYIETLKSLHVHFLFKFSKGATFAELVDVLGIESQFIEKPKSGRYSYDNKLSYLIHAKDGDKFLYSPSEVHTLVGEDFQNIYNIRRISWEQGRAKKTSSRAGSNIEKLVIDITSGKIKKKDVLHDPNLFEIYIFNKSKVNEAFDIYSEYKAMKTLEDIENGLFTKSTIFIKGASGLGKTTFAKKIAKELKKLAIANGEDWDSIVTAATNPFDEVQSQELLILDDVRGNATTASDWLKLTDKYNISALSARFKNKGGTVKTIIITSPHHPLQFFFESKNGSREDPSQFIRRINQLVLIDKGSSGESIYKVAIPERKQNPVIHQIPNHENKIALDYDFSRAEEMNYEDLLIFIVETIRLNNQWSISYEECKKTITENSTDQSENGDSQTR